MISQYAWHIAAVALSLSMHVPAIPAEEPANGAFQIIGHHQGAAGVELPAREEPQLSEGFRQGIANASIQLTLRMQEDLNALAGIPPLPHCASNARPRWFQLPAVPSDYTDALLFIRGELPEKIGEVFGRGLTIHRCLNEPGDTCAIAANELNVRCVPSRVQVAERRLLILEGVDALKNYDQEKRGWLHPEVAKRLQAYSGEAGGSHGR